MRYCLFQIALQSSSSLIHCVIQSLMVIVPWKQNPIGHSMSHPILNVDQAISLIAEHEQKCTNDWDHVRCFNNHYYYRCRECEFTWKINRKKEVAADADKARLLFYQIMKRNMKVLTLQERKEKAQLRNENDP